MKALQIRAFRPEHQSSANVVVEFDLRPLNIATLWTLQRSLDENGSPTWEGAAAAFRYAVMGWRGLTTEYSEAEKRQVLEGDGSIDWLIWIGEVAGEAYRTAMLSGEERKN